ETEFERIQREKNERNETPWAPFESREEWELAKWLATTGLTQTDIGKFLDLKIVSISRPPHNGVKPSFKSSHLFYKKIDSLPGRSAKWMLEVFEAEGDVLGEDGQLKKERVELWKRNTVECVRELMGNAAFRGCIRYKPERQYADPEGKTRIYGNM
ncbi:hypothetical protein C8Q79DRAFT_891571, partial [Trametes meyenii]